MAKKTKTRPPLLARRTKRLPMRHAGPSKVTPVEPKRVALPAAAPSRDALEFVRGTIRDIPDFPKPGILFKDITPLLASPRAFHIVLDQLAERFIGEHIDVVVGVEARGFVFGGALAARLNASFVPARKPGKLPASVDTVIYDTEYSTAELQMHKDSIPEESRCLVVDDLLATGGTAKAAGDLVRMQGGYVVAFAFVVELSFLAGRERLLPVRVETVLRY
ncbi:MAG TPA: adenine phosphoribosyltransferase [Polyangiaceae bacterium]|nr:adenine phosphoribosyltransferase [Polyangiaceae bacterium]